MEFLPNSKENLNKIYQKQKNAAAKTEEILENSQDQIVNGLGQVGEIEKKVQKTIWDFLFPTIIRRRRSIKDYFSIAKNGTITGAADNDPAGIVTYAQAGAKAGYGLLWLIIVITPVFIALESLSAHVAVATKKGLAKLIRDRYGKKFALIIASIIALANVSAIGADVAAMSELLGIFTHLHWWIFYFGITFILCILLIRGGYSFLSRFFFLLTPIFLCYIISAFLMHPSWLQIFKDIIAPTFQSNSEYWLIAVALIGTTIGPYVLFWQNTQEIEEHKTIRNLNDEKFGTRFGITYGNLMSAFITICAGTALYTSGATFNSAKDVALLLKPIAGQYAFSLFSIGIIGAGLLAVPILASSTAYIFSDIFDWKGSLDRKVNEAKSFYAVLLASLFIGAMFILSGLSPVKMLIYSQVLAGLVMPILILILLLIAHNKKIMGEHKPSTTLIVLTWISLFITLLVDIVLVTSWI